MAALAGVRGFAGANRGRFVRELAEFVRIPSVSADPRHARHVRDAARWLASRLERAGLERVVLAPTGGPPVVYGEWLRAGHAPTVLVYGHYDVQPADPVDAWRSPPFAPVIRDGCLHGRGASDDKGQLLAHVAAIESWLRTGRRLPVNVRCLFEGEEEVGSPHLRAFLRRHRDRLACDSAVLSDTRFLAPGRPALISGFRGHLGLEVAVQALRADVHSGAFGGAVHNPIQALADMIGRLHDRKGRVAIPGFYDRVRAWSPAKRGVLRRSGPSDAMILRDAGALSPWGEHGFTLHERITLRPALTINGMSGGYQGPGPKGVIPARASAKLGLRLVPDQEPEEIASLMRAHLIRTVPPGVRLTVRILQGVPPALVDRRHPAMKAACRAYRIGFGRAPVVLRSGGTIPVVGMLQRELNTTAVPMGFALPGDGMHAPNERFSLEQFARAIDTCIAYYAEVGKVERARTPSRRRSSLELPARVYRRAGSALSRLG